MRSSLRPKSLGLSHCASSSPAYFTAAFAALGGIQHSTSGCRTGGRGSICTADGQHPLRPTTGQYLRTFFPKLDGRDRAAGVAITRTGVALRRPATVASFVANIAPKMQSLSRAWMILRFCVAVMLVGFVVRAR